MDLSGREHDKRGRARKTRRWLRQQQPARRMERLERRSLNGSAQVQAAVEPVTRRAAGKSRTRRQRPDDRRDKHHDSSHLRPPPISPTASSLAGDI